MIGLEGFGLQLAKGVMVTLAVSLCAVIFGIGLSILFTLTEFSQLNFLKSILKSITAFIRGLPELLVLFTIYFGGSALLTKLFHRSIQVSAFSAGVLALGTIFATYATQTLRGALLELPKGQTEAGKAMGLSGWIIFKRIVFPQVWHHALPGLGNLWLVLLKDSALVALIGLGDLMNKAQLAASTTREPFKFYIMVAFLFLLLTSVSQLILKLFSVNKF
ncbi:ABC transporter permease subunit [Coxiella endosymbiont of Ornithodoros amblus]|uniref:ABC transporter permease n=1 Tax=Coxiella endosymbiont of Ornithodoros amblus TaxID=1656166 RepID=UPI00244DF8C8|nr:ABC transporter permease subunit [Coxiella endosymbiont of Ornithodoros amblus]MBW5802698.1 ABC transporter permease subunit [Coxiella endosymbiont of Ornithodoros amblus]